MADLKKNVAEVKSAYNIVDYIQQSGIRLKASGGKWKGLCPFHTEKSPSFSVDDSFQSFHCFGCGAHGDLISFVQHQEHLSFMESLKKLAEEKNIVLDLDNKNESGVDYSALRECMRDVSNFFVREYRKLAPDHPARQEVKSRGVSEKKMAYGYAPEQRGVLYRHLKSLNYSDEVILATGACSKLEGKDVILDFWNGRLMFFITNAAGRPVGWSGRKLFESDTRGKYVNSRDSLLFNKSECLYNIAKAKKQASDEKEMYVCEGQFDVAALVEADLTNAVASSGTAFTEKQALIIRRLVSEDGKIIFCFDADAAGQKAVERIFANIPAVHAQSYVVSIPSGKDPCDFRLERGNEALIKLLSSNRKPIVKFVLDNVAAKYNLDSESEASRYIEEASKILKTITNNNLRARYLEEVALASFVGVDTVLASVERAVKLDADEAPTPATVVEVTVEARPALDEEESSEEILEKIDRDQLYGISAKLVALTMRDRELYPRLEGVQNLLPHSLESVVTELISTGVEERIVAEKFTLTSVVEKLGEPNYFPFQLSSELSQKQFEVLAKELLKISSRRKILAARRKVARVLENSPKDSAKYLDRAIAAEARGLNQDDISSGHDPR